MENIQYYEHTCACGCGGQIKVSYRHKYDGIPKYINNHHSRGKDNPNYGKYGEGHPAYGYTHTEEHKQRMRELKKGVKRTEEQRQNISKAKKGKCLGKDNPNSGICVVHEAESASRVYYPWTTFTWWE